MITNIRVYREVFGNGDWAYTWKEQDGRGAAACATLETAADFVKSRVDGSNKSVEQVNIDFSPFHNIECPSGLAPRFCQSLTEAEIQEFWKHFTAQK